MHGTISRTAGRRERPRPPFATATVREAMHPGILTCPPDASLAEVAAMLSAHRVHCVAVIGVATREGERLVWGIVSDLDVVRAAQSADARQPTAGEIAATEPVAIGADEPLAAAAQAMAEHDVHHLVVVAGRDPQPVGIVSCLDLADALAQGGQ